MINMQFYLSRSLRPPKRAMISVTLLTVICALSVPSTRAFVDGPALSIDATERDFGDVYKGEVLETVFTVRNNGSAPLTLAEKSLTGQADFSRDTRVAVARLRAFNDGLRPVAFVARRAAPS